MLYVFIKTTEKVFCNRVGSLQPIHHSLSTSATHLHFTSPLTISHVISFDRGTWFVWMSSVCFVTLSYRPKCVLIGGSCVTLFTIALADRAANSRLSTAT